MQLTDWLLVEVALLLIGLTQISLTKSSFNHPSVIEFLGLPGYISLLSAFQCCLILYHYRLPFASHFWCNAASSGAHAISSKGYFLLPDSTRMTAVFGIFSWNLNPPPPPPSHSRSDQDRMKRLTSLSACSCEENNSCIIPRNCASSPSYVLYICTSTHHLVNRTWTLIFQM
jgi:hypothetical protein